VVIAGVFVTGCVIQEPRAITEIGRARKALDDARKAGKADCAPGQFAELEKRFLQARGVYYACNDAEAIKQAQALAADANALGCPQAAAPVANRQPACRLTVTPPQTQVGEVVTLDASGSSDPDGDPLSFTWDFGDGTPPVKTTVPRTTHTYSRVGNFAIKVTIDDGRGGVCTATGTETTTQKFVLAEKGRQVLFDFDKAVLKPAARTQLAAVVQALKDQPSLRVQVAGHTDSVGSDAYNMRLSQRRAEAVVNYLIQSSPTARENFVVEWFGKRQPIASNDTAEGRAQNRRVEITLSPGK
jgi:outer membrane protein OmpA-like peptidoglycan-associated protein